MSKQFILCKQGSDYNDEYTFFTDAADPIKVFADRAKADAECLKFNLDWIKNHLYDEQFIGEMWPVGDDVLDEICPGLANKVEDYRTNPFKGLDDEQLKKLYKELKRENFTPYTVREIPLED